MIEDPISYMSQETADKIVLTAIIGTLAVLLFLAIKSIFSGKLPEWYGLYGEEYLKWKRGEKGKQDNSD